MVDPLAARQVAAAMTVTSSQGDTRETFGQAAEMCAAQRAGRDQIGCRSLRKEPSDRLVFKRARRAVLPSIAGPTANPPISIIGPNSTAHPPTTVAIAVTTVA